MTKCPYNFFLTKKIFNLGLATFQDFTAHRSKKNKQMVNSGKSDSKSIAFIYIPHYNCFIINDLLQYIK